MQNRAWVRAGNGKQSIHTIRNSGINTERIKICMSDGHQILNGIGVYAGTSHGRVAFVMPAPEADPDEGPCTDWEAGSARIR